MISMTSIRATKTVSILGLLVALAGCSAESGTAGVAGTSDTARTQTAALASSSGDAHAERGPARGPHRGPDFLLVAALHAPIDLTDAQRATLESALAASRPAAPPAFDRTRAKTLAAGIRAGKVDATALSAPADDGAAARQAASAQALATLHATLTPDQRRALVDAVTKRSADGGPKTDDPRPGMDHARGGRGATGRVGPMGPMLDGLDLTTAQEDAIRAGLDAQRPSPPTDADRAAMKAQHAALRAAMDAKLQTFAGDTFDAAAFVTPTAGAVKGAGEHAVRFASELATVTSVLDAAQREKLAARIEAGPPARTGHGPGRGG
jgi:Spy/CpxP family protein refolding chaperone